MKFGTYLALTGAVSAASSNSKMSDIVKGVLKGALDAEGFTDIETCITDAKAIVDDAEIAFNDFKSHDVSDIIAGVKEVATMLQQIKTAMADCSQTKADWKKLEEMAKVLAHPSSLAWHLAKDLVVNGADIFHEIDDSIKQYNAGNWEQFGYDIGEASAKVLLGSQLSTMDKRTQLAEILQGLTNAFGGHFDLMALLFCIQEEDKALLMFDAAIQTFIYAWQNKSWSDALGGVLVTFAAINQVKQGLPACEAIIHDEFIFKQIDQSLNIATHPLEHFEILEDDVLINGRSIVADGMAATEAYLAKDFVKFGEKFGEILKLATEKQEQKPQLSTGETKEVAEALQGFLQATNVGSFNFTALLVCIYQMDQAAIEMVAAFQIIRSAIHDKTIMEGVAGALFAFAGFQQFRKSLPVCAAIAEDSADWTTFDEIMNVLENPVKNMRVVEENVVMNGVTITEDFTEAMQAMNHEEYKDFGYLLGKSMTLATQQEKNLFLY